MIQPLFIHVQKEVVAPKLKNGEGKGEEDGGEEEEGREE